MTKLFLSIIAVISLSACIYLQYAEEPNTEYRAYIGKRFEVLQLLSINGVRGRRGVVSYVLLAKSLRSGPEIAFVEYVLPGNIFEIVNVERCIQCRGLRIRFVIQFLNPSFQRFENIVLDSYYSEIFSLSSEKDVVIDFAYLKPINRNEI